MAIGLVAYKGEVVFSDSVGEASPGAPATVETIVRLDSLTKPLTAAAVLSLADAGKLSLNDPVSKFLPEFSTLTVDRDGEVQAASVTMTIRHLLTHTGGLAGYSPDVDALWEAPTNQVFAAGIARLPLRQEPGGGFQYGNAYEVLPAIVEAASGLRFDDYLRSAIFEPLGMKNTYFAVPADKKSRFAALYDRDDNGVLYVKSLPTAPETESFPSGGGGAKSTVGDYLKFAQMLKNGGKANGVRILSESAVESMTSPQVSRTLPGAWQNDYAWGYGLSIRERNADETDPKSAGAFGWNGGYGTLFFVDPTKDLIAVVFTQLQWGNEHDVRERFEKAVYTAVEGN